MLISYTDTHTHTHTQERMLDVDCLRPRGGWTPIPPVPSLLGRCGQDQMKKPGFWLYRVSDSGFNSGICDSWN